MEQTSKGLNKFAQTDNFNVEQFNNANMDRLNDLIDVDEVKNTYAEFPAASAALENKKYLDKATNTKYKCTKDDDNVWNWVAEGTGGGGGGGSTINITTSDDTLYSKQVTLYRYSGGTLTQVKTATISASGTATMSNIMDTGTFKLVVAGNLARKWFEVPNYGAYYITLENTGEWGYRIKKSESNPATRVEYLDDTDNYKYDPAHMDYANDTFVYGGWQSFCDEISKSVMLKYDGTVDYELNENDNTKKKDGTGSDIANYNYQGNAMVGIKLLYTKRNEVTIDGEIYQYVRLSSTARTGYKAYAHTNYQGNVVEWTYYPKYKGYIYDGKVRSLSGFRPQSALSGGASAERPLCLANNPSGKHIWDMGLASKWFLMQDLCYLISKTCDSQTAFGNGNIYYSGSGEAANFCNTGTTNTKGKFWGSNSSTTHTDVKVFGIEGWWGNRWDRILGWNNVNGVQKLKLTYGTEDGSVATDYNFDGTDYIALTNMTPSGTNGGFQSDNTMFEYGNIPKVASGSASTYACDGLWFNNAQNNLALVGGDCHNSLHCGVGCVVLYGLASYVTWYVGVSVSAIPESTT